MRKKLIAANWKMNGDSTTIATLLDHIIRNNDDIHTEMAVFPPFPYLTQCIEMLKNTAIAVGAQNVCEFPDGAYTGEVSAAMLKNLHCRYVIIGHSERRHYFGENNASILKKCEMACCAGIIPILCVGETLAEREKNRTWSVVQEQLAVVSRLKDNCADFNTIVIAYEPVWAIGTGKTATPEEAQTVHAAIRKQLSTIEPTLANTTRILYGGSVKADNAKALFAMPDIDGALVGGASLHAQEFIKIANS